MVDNWMALWVLGEIVLKFSREECLSPPRKAVPAENLIETERLTIRPPTSQDAQITAEFHSANREHLRTWEPARDNDFYTRNIGKTGSNGRKKAFAQIARTLFTFF